MGRPRRRRAGLDTGSIRDTTGNALRGYGGIRVRVAGALTGRAAVMNGELMRGFGLRYDGYDRFRTTQAVQLGAVSITRAIRIQRNDRWARWYDTFTNTTTQSTTVEVVFGGQTGYNTGENQSEIVATSSGDTTRDDRRRLGHGRHADDRRGRAEPERAERRRQRHAGHERVGRELPARPVQPAAPRHRARGQPPGLRAPVPARCRRDQVARPFRGHRNGRAPGHRLGGRQRPARGRHRGQRGPQRRDLADRGAARWPISAPPSCARSSTGAARRSPPACPASTRTSAPASSSSTRPPRRSRPSS